MVNSGISGSKAGLIFIKNIIIVYKIGEPVIDNTCEKFAKTT